MLLESWSRSLDLPIGQYELGMRIMHAEIKANRRRLWPRTCLCLVIDGGGYYFDSAGKHEVSAGDVFVHSRVREHQVQRTNPKGWLQWTVVLSPELEDLLISLGVPLSEVCYRSGDLGERQNGFNRLRGVVASNASDAQVLQELQRYLLLIRPQQEPRDHIDHAANILRNDLTGHIDIAELASELGYSGVHFRRLFKARHGQSPRTWRDAARIERAKELLVEEDMNVRETAEALGYANPFAFSRHFAKQTGVPPSEWQREG